MKYKFLILLTLVALLSSVGAQQILTFDQAIAMALEKNNQIQVARNNALIQTNNAHLGNAGLLPRLDLAGSANYQDYTSAQGASIYDGASTTTLAQLQLSYTLFDGFGNVYRLKKLNSQSDRGKIEARAMIENTLLYLSQVYYATALSQENVEIATQLIGISHERLERAQKRAEYGQANGIEVLSARVDLNADSVSFFNAGLKLAEARRNLNAILNRDQETILVIDQDVDFNEMESRQIVLQKARDNNASFLATLAALKEAKFDVALARASWSPSIGLTGAMGMQQTQPDMQVGVGDPDKFVRAGVTVNFNLFNGLQDRSRLQNAKLASYNRELLKNEESLYLENSVANIYQAFENSNRVLALEKENLQVAELNFQRAKALFELGRVTNTQFREAQLNLIRSKTNISAAKYDTKLFECELLALTGQLIQ